MSEIEKKTILLVEDEAIIAISEKLQLEKYGYAVQTVVTGEQAVEAVSTSPRIDLVLMDINLGDGLDGTQAAELILENHDVPIVFVSSHSERDIVEKTEAITSYGYVVKNSSITVLDACIKMAFKLFDEKERYKAVNNKLEATLNAIPDLMFIVDRNGYFKDYHTEHTLAKVVMEPTRIIGSNLKDIFPPEEAAVQLALYRTCLESGKIQTHSYELTIEGAKQYFTLQLAKLDDNQVLATIHDVTDQKRAELAFRESKETNEMLLNVAAELIIAHDSRGNITLLNESGHEMLGYAFPELVGKNWFDTCLPEDIRSDVKRYFCRLENGELGNADSRENDVVTKNGERKTILWHNAVIKDKEGKFVGLFSSGEDITERKSNETALKESQERLNFALEVSGLGEWELNLKTNKIKRNARWAEMLGYSLSEINDGFQQGIDLQHPDDREAVGKAVRDYHEGRTDSFKTIYRMRTKSGTYKWIQDCGKIIERDENGKPLRLCGTHADIDEQKQAEDRLEAEKKRLQNVLSGTNAGTWEWNIQTGDAEIDAASAALLGYALDELQPEIFEAWMRLKHPDDMEESKNLLSKHASGETDFYSFESRMKHKNGTWVWIDARGKVVDWDKDGKPLRIFGTHTDITERKKNEIALRESRERLLFALEGSGLGEWDWNLKTNKIKRNERWAGILGYALPEIKDDLLQGVELQHPDDREGVWKAIQDHLNGKTDYYDSSYRMRAKDGQYRWIHDCGKIMERDESGKPLRLCGTHADITQQKMAEERIRGLLAEKELILKEVHHRIKNNMNTISSLLSLQAQAVAEPAAITALEDAIARVKSMGILYDSLYQSAVFTELSVKDYLPALVDEIACNFPNSQLVQINTTIEDFVLDTRLLQPLGIIVNELLTNIMKYAFAGSESGVVDISAARADGHVAIAVQDNGMGIPESVSFENSTGFGLQLVQALTQQLHGTIRMERGNGTRIVLEFEG